jgi:hypothetical protein
MPGGFDERIRKIIAEHTNSSFLHAGGPVYLMN